jgi:hypothetical protein
MQGRLCETSKYQKPAARDDQPPEKLHPSKTSSAGNEKQHTQQGVNY